MFTGIIEDLGTLLKATPNDLGIEFLFEPKRILPAIKVGDSVACNGVCLSATSITKNSFCCYAVKETLEKTNLGSLQQGDKVNFELAMGSESRVGGHHVSGHVDGVARVISWNSLQDGSAELWLELPASLQKYCIAKGSIALNGVSLTIAAKEKNKIKIALIPITIANTNLNQLEEGRAINVEVDLMGKYIENFLMAYFEDSDNPLIKELAKGMQNV